MKKIIILFFLCIALTGCSVNYTLDFNEDEIKENIVLNFDENIRNIASKINGDGLYLEKELVENRIPALNNAKGFYLKNINIKESKSIVTLNYTYSYENLINSYIVNKCFEKTIFVNGDESYSFELSGAFTCFDQEDINIKISSKYKVINNNASSHKDGYYIWKLKRSDKTHNIRFLISKTKLETEKEPMQFGSFKIITLIIILLGSIIFFFIQKRINRNTF